MGDMSDDPPEPARDPPPLDQQISEHISVHAIVTPARAEYRLIIPVTATPATIETVVSEFIEQTTKAATKAQMDTQKPPGRTTTSKADQQRLADESRRRDARTTMLILLAAGAVAMPILTFSAYLVGLWGVLAVLFGAAVLIIVAATFALRQSGDLGEETLFKTIERVLASFRFWSRK